jgi:hypothetical protein
LGVALQCFLKFSFAVAMSDHPGVATNRCANGDRNSPIEQLAEEDPTMGFGIAMFFEGCLLKAKSAWCHLAADKRTFP